MNNVTFESTSPPSKNKSGLDGSRCNVLRIPALDGLRYGIPYRSSSFRDRTMTMTIRASCVICTRTRNAMKRKQRIIFSRDRHWNEDLRSTVRQLILPRSQNGERKQEISDRFSSILEETKINTVHSRFVKFYPRILDFLHGIEQRLANSLINTTNEEGEGYRKSIKT